MPSAEALFTLIRDQYVEDEAANLNASVEHIGDVACQMARKMLPALRTLANVNHWRDEADKKAQGVLEMAMEEFIERIIGEFPQETSAAYEAGVDLGGIVRKFIADLEV